MKVSSLLKYRLKSLEKVCLGEISLKFPEIWKAHVSVQLYVCVCLFGFTSAIWSSANLYAYYTFQKFISGVYIYRWFFFTEGICSVVAPWVAGLPAQYQFCSIYCRSGICILMFFELYSGLQPWIHQIENRVAGAIAHPLMMTNASKDFLLVVANIGIFLVYSASNF